MANRLHPVHKRTRGDIQQCKDCNGDGGIPNPERPPRNMDCSTCSGQGFFTHRAPYRLADGTWSDGVDRSKRIDIRKVSARFEVSVGKYSSYVWHEAFQTVEFDTWAEAIAYADKHARMARTNQGENKWATYPATRITTWLSQ